MAYLLGLYTERCMFASPPFWHVLSPSLEVSWTLSHAASTLSKSLFVSVVTTESQAQYPAHSGVRLMHNATSRDIQAAVHSGSMVMAVTFISFSHSSHIVTALI